MVKNLSEVLKEILGVEGLLLAPEGFWGMLKNFWLMLKDFSGELRECW